MNHLSKGEAWRPCGLAVHSEKDCICPVLAAVSTDTRIASVVSCPSNGSLPCPVENIASPFIAKNTRAGRANSPFTTEQKENIRQAAEEMKKSGTVWEAVKI